ncbi:WYL domain-containing protein, partial [Streptomyces sp. NPDC005568]|uniref:WYL domain-containing protein n=1 Tax=Streptomyces sp. NPDC005568 TaxID=3156887 RepID=UPI0033ACA3A3
HPRPRGAAARRHREPGGARAQDAVFADRRLRLRYRHSGRSEPSRYTVDPYGLVSKAGVWYLVADRRGRPQLFRADRVRSATLLAEPVRRRPGVELADAWEVLRRQVEERPGGIDVTVRVLRSRLDMFLRLNAAALRELPEDDGESEWVTAGLSYGVVQEARSLLAFADRIEVLSPPEVRAELAAAAAAVTELYGTPDGRAGGGPAARG